MKCLTMSSNPFLLEAKSTYRFSKENIGTDYKKQPIYRKPRISGIILTAYSWNGCYLLMIGCARAHAGRYHQFAQLAHEAVMRCSWKAERVIVKRRLRTHVSGWMTAFTLLMPMGFNNRSTPGELVQLSKL